MLPSKKIAPVCDASLPFISFQEDAGVNEILPSEYLSEVLFWFVIFAVGPVATIIPITIKVISKIAPITSLLSLMIWIVLSSSPFLFIIGLSSKISSCIGAFTFGLGNLYPQFSQIYLLLKFSILLIIFKVSD